VRKTATEIRMSTDTILEKARVVVYGRGEQDYGHPRENMTCNAQLWNAFLSRKGIIVKDNPITERDVALMMVLTKVAREGQTAKEDNLVDIAGWAEVANRVETGR